MTQIKAKDILKWTRALRSGKYTQAYGRLQRGEGYCCLGVACKVFVPKKLQKRKEDGSLFGGTFAGQPYSPRWLQIIDNNFMKKTKESLIYLNDSAKYSFDEIADILELVYVHGAFDNVEEACNF